MKEKVHFYEAKHSSEITCESMQAHSQSYVNDESMHQRAISDEGVISVMHALHGYHQHLRTVSQAESYHRP